MIFFICFVAGILFTLIVQSASSEVKRRFPELSRRERKNIPEYLKKHAEDFQHYSWSREQASDLDLENEKLFDISEFTIKNNNL